MVLDAEEKYIYFLSRQKFVKIHVDCKKIESYTRSLNPQRYWQEINLITFKTNLQLLGRGALENMVVTGTSKFGAV